MKIRSAQNVGRVPTSRKTTILSFFAAFFCLFFLGYLFREIYVCVFSDVSVFFLFDRFGACLSRTLCGIAHPLRKPRLKLLSAQEQQGLAPPPANPSHATERDEHDTYCGSLSHSYASVAKSKKAANFK